ncbi:MAG TPA: class I SAM-dependent methyltransferase [Desulfitobacteriaceae bacterium]|nr:class I SAM-dependent methyltransferase [Desulfitobacteriaceae bacterium]
MQTVIKKPRYGNWVSNTLIRRFMVLFLVFVVPDAALWTFVPGWFPLKVLLALPAALCLVCVGYFVRSRWLFAAEGGGVQNKVLDELISRVEWDGCGRVLDIGCGSGALSIRLAKKYKDAAITGIDYWGGGWEYSRKQCEENARLEGVGGRTHFQQASASKLPFEDEAFDLVVSNLTFHEVKDSENKLDVLKEALRVVKKGGQFVFQDLFLIRQYYGTPDKLTAAVKAMGVKKVYFVDTSKASFIPRALKLPFMIGALGLIYGERE